MKNNLMKIVLIISFISFMSVPAGGQQSGWRGPLRSGIYNETGLLKSWPRNGPALLWEATGVGTGYSSVTVTNDAVYITGRKGVNDVLSSFTQNGKKNWELIYGKSSMSNYPDSRCTPTYYKGKLFLVSGQGDMVCVGKDGKIIWSVNYFQKYSAKTPMFGISESPLVVDNKVIGTPGGSKAAMVAFDIENGNVIWETPSIDEGTQYVNPLLIEEGGKKTIVTLSTGHIICADASSGKLLWKFNYEAENAEQTGRRNHINTPLYKDGFLFEANGYQQVAVKIKLNVNGAEPTLVWKNTDITPHVGGMVLIGKYIYSSTHDTNSKGRWICVDWITGKTMWTTDWHNKGSIIAADGMIYIYEEKSGYIGLVNPSGEKLDVVSSFRIIKGEGPYWAHPMIDKGRLFVRHGDYMAVYSLKAK
ncbi:MAG: alcohol dehydrogenase [Odoribacter sp.]|nr:alcohol dehydrogenase [Odoribacter sp.]